MALGFFDPPQTKAHKRGAAMACKLREQSGRDAGIEIMMLHSRHNHGVALINSIGASDNEAVHELSEALYGAKDILDRTNAFADHFIPAVTSLKSSAKNAMDYERVASLELEGRGALIALRDQVRKRLDVLGVACLEFQQHPTQRSDA